MLSNILLDNLDKELERRGQRFVRHADDFQVFVRSERTAQRVFESVQRYLTQRLKLVVNRYLRGWIGYSGLARQFDEFVELDGWIRRRVRMCYWKQWRYPRTKVRHLVQLGVDLQMAIKHAISRKRYWRMSRTPAMRYAMPNKWLEQQGLLSLKQLWGQLAPLRGTA